MLELVFALAVAGAPSEPVDVPVLVIENGATVSADEPEEVAPLAVRFFGRLDERLTTDLSWIEGEPVFEARTSLSMGVRYEPTAAWSFGAEGRLRHRLVGWHGVDEGWTARIEPELRQLMAVHRPEHGPELSVGLGVVRWGRTTLARPLDVVSPEDWRDGPFAPIDERRLPVVSASARFTVGSGVLEALYVPFFFPQHAPLSGELAPPLEGEAPGPRQDFVTSGEVGFRLTQRVADLDVGLSWLWRRDRVPGPSGHARQHMLGLDMGLRLGAVGLVGEVAFFSERRLVRPDLSTEGHFGLEWAFEARLQPAIFLDLVVGVSGRHSPAAGGVYLAEGRESFWFDYSLAMLLAFDGRLRLNAEGKVELSRGGHHVRVGVFGRATEALELGLGVLVADGAAASYALPALYRETSHVWLEVVWAF